MPLNLNKLSALAVIKTSKPGYYGDGGGAAVCQTWFKSWIFRFKVAGRQRELGLGGLHTVELAKTRVLARECRTLLLDGKDPLEARKGGTARGCTAAGPGDDLRSVSGGLYRRSPRQLEERHARRPMEEHPLDLCLAHHRRAAGG
jgi:hypothetical protein